MTVSEDTAPMPTRHNWIFLTVFFSVHAAAITAIALYRSWSALAVAAVGHAFFGWVGIGLCYHRLLTHKGFKVKPWFERVLVTIGALNVQGGPITWVATHLQHHAKSDKPGDPHSPRDGGFWWSHVGWMLKGGQRQYGFRAEKRLADIRYYRFLEAGQLLFQLPLAVLLFWMGGLPFVMYGIFVRLVASWHITFCINSVCHLWGSRRFETKDDSRNNALVNLFAGGEGLHNNHHDSPSTAITAVRWWDFDATGWLIRGLEKVGLATDVVKKR